MERSLSAVLILFLSLGCASFPQSHSPLDALDPTKLSKEEREIEHPKETVAWLRGHTRSVASLAFSKDGRLLASSSWDNTVRVWKFGEALPMLRAELSGSPSGLAFAGDGRTLICGGKDEAVHIWDVGGDEAKLVRRLPGHKSRPFALAYSPAGDLLVTACNDPVLRVWKWNQGDPETWGILANEQVASVGISSLSFSADGKLLAAGNYAGERSLRLWDVRPNGLAERQIPKSRAKLVCFSPVGKLLAFAGEEGKISRWEVEVHKTLEHSPLVGPSGSTIRALAFSPSGKMLASAGQDKRVVLWDVSTAKKLHDWNLGEEVKALAFAPDGRHLAWGNEDGSVYILRLKR